MWRACHAVTMRVHHQHRRAGHLLHGERLLRAGWHSPQPGRLVLRARGSQQRARPTRRSKPSWLRAGGHTPAQLQSLAALLPSHFRSPDLESRTQNRQENTLRLQRRRAARHPAYSNHCLRTQSTQRSVRCTIARRRRHSRCTRCENAVPAGQTERAQQACETRAAPAGRE